MKTEIILFVSQFALIFLLGFQAQNVRDGQRLAAMGTSFMLGVSQLFQWKLMPNATPSQMAVWLFAGPLGIVFSMWLHPKLFKKRG